MKKDIKKNIRTHFNESYQQLNSFENIYKDRDHIILENYKRQNNYALFIASVLLMSLNIAWIVMSILIKNIRHNTSTLGTIGILCTTIASAYMIYFIASKRYKTTKNYELSVLAFHTLIYLSSMFLSYSYYVTTNNSKGLGISMSALLLLICVVIPLSNKKYSSISLSLMAITTIVPAFLCKAGLHQYIVRFGLLFIMSVAFLAFSRITKTSSKVIADLSDVSFKDFQTQTLNRRALSEYFNKLQNKDILNIGLMVFDIDDFKKYNDEYSHTMGDEALIRICDAAKSILDENSLIFRYGSGEFIIIIENTTDQNLLVTALKLRDAVEQLNIEMKQSNWRKFLTVTIGCTSATKSEFLKHDMLSEADSQLAIGKHGTKNCVVFKGKIFVAEGEISIEQQPTVYTERVNHAITEAMKSHDLRAFYQPMYDTVSHKLVGAEALSRWIKPDGTVILPGEFIPELEKNSSIIAIDWYMFEEACKLLKRQKTEGIPQVRISVNFSRMHALYERDISKRLCEIADSYGVAHSLFEIEITESAYIRMPNIIEPFIESIRQEGFSVAIDDFGTGAASLGLMKNVDVDTLKIDKSLITTNYSGTKDKVLLESIVYLAHRLQLNSVAEGVETPEQFSLLKNLGCNQIQGYFFSVPLDEDQFIAACKSNLEPELAPDSIIVQNKSAGVQMLIDNIFDKYSVIVISNITQNSFYTISYNGTINHKFLQSGKLEDLLNEVCSIMHPDDIAPFNNLVSRDKQLEAIANGQEKVSLVIRVKGDDEKNYTKVYCTNFYLKEKDSDDVLAVTLCGKEN